MLQYVAGLSKATAEGIVKYRDQNGKLTNRRQLLNVARLGPKAFEQCAGFIRISDGDNPLDNTSVHPESYDIAEKILQQLGYAVTDLTNPDTLAQIRRALEQVNLQQMAAQLAVGEATLNDIIQALKKPGRDPREELTPPLLRSDVLLIEDLQVGMTLTGTVRNVVDFGAFVDIGVKHDGLVHITQMSERYVKHPMEIVAVGDIVQVSVIELDIKRNRIALSMKMTEKGEREKL